MAVTTPNLLLESRVRVRQSGVRSINVEHDLQSPDITSAYILTAQARQTLHRIIEHSDHHSPVRAWTLTGPYGSGKSFFGLFLMNLLSKSLPSHGKCVRQLREVDIPLEKRIADSDYLLRPKGLLPVPIIGYRSTLQRCILEGFQHALLPLQRHAPVRDLLDDDLFKSSQPDSRSLIRWLQQLQHVVAQPESGYSGVLIVLDEMGKLLEYASSHPEQVDIYLLQELAEFANRSGDIPLLFVGILHQSFERYAGRLDGTTQREWSKIQGRFEDVGFQEPPHQQMWLLARAIEVTDLDLHDMVNPIMQESANEAVAIGWRPPLMREQDFVKVCAQAYPLHPSVLVAISYLFRRLAQNERSLFAYLASQEPFGFQEFIRQQIPPATIRLPALFDYLTANFQGRLYASLRARLITETLERLSNAPKLSELATDVLKTIGLLNWLAESSPLQATESSIRLALRDNERSDEKIRQTLRSLQRQSLVVFRRYNQTYVIWQGSDVDIEDRLSAAQQQLTGTFSLADVIQQYMPPRPLVARRHSYQTGFTRYFNVRYVDSYQRDQIILDAAEGAGGVVLLCLPANQHERDEFVEWAQQKLGARSDLVVGVAQRTMRLAELCYELRCLHWVRDNTPDLRDDPVARRELRSRLNSLELLIRNELERTLSLPRLAETSGCQWFYAGKDISSEAVRGLSYLLSAVCDTLYPDAPRLWNELINRRTLSSQGAAARRNLIEAMLKGSHLSTLGIEGFPPERSMYESLLKSSGMHRPTENGWVFSEPPDDDPLGLQPAWQAIHDYVFQLPPELRGVFDLFDQLKAPPFGLSDGVLPVLLCAFVLVYQDEMTMYYEGTLLPEPGIADWEVLLRRPELFAVAGCRVSGPRADVVARLARGLQTPPAAMPVVRDLIRRLKTLPEHAWRTNRLTARTLAVRRAVDRARAPERLLFYDLPIALDLTPIPADAVTDQIEPFFARLNGALQELSDAMPHTLEAARDQLLDAYGLAPSESGWSAFIAQASDLASHVKHPTLAPLLHRAADSTSSQAALESVLAYVAGRPPRLWHDGDVDRFADQVQTLGKLFQTERNGHLNTANLSAAQQRRSRTLATELRNYVSREIDEDPLVIRAALQALLVDLGDQATVAEASKPDLVQNKHEEPIES